MVTLVVLFIATGILAQRAADTEARDEARSINAVLARSVAKPALNAGLIKGRVGNIDRFDRAVLQRLLVGDVQRVNIWAADGHLIYSDRAEFIGREVGLDPSQSAIMRSGGTGEVVLGPDTSAAANPTNAPLGTVRIFTRISAADGTPVLFEAFYSLSNIKDRQQEIYSPFREITLGALVALLLLVTPIIRVLTRQVTSAGEERERLLQAGIDTSDAERRRIARDLHDGVVQDLAGTSFSLAALARDPTLTDRARSSLSEANRAVRDTLKSLRALLSEIHPPEIHAADLAAALADLVAPAAAQGLQSSVSVEGADRATDEQASLVLRVAQESVRNALRHSNASSLSVTVRPDGDVLVLEVVDNGDGFDTEAAPAPDRYGLKGMASLVRDRGGRLTVRSTPGAGTTVELEVVSHA